MCVLCELAERKAKALEAGRKEWTPIEDRVYKYTHRLEEAKMMGLSLKDYMKGKKRWGSLHGHSEFSLLDGGARVRDIFLKAKQMGQDFVAITDHGNLFGAVKAHKIAQELGIKHIVGCELYITPVGRNMADKDFKKGERPYHHLVVWAKNNVGYKNLCKLVSIGYTHGFYRAPRIDREALEAHREGLIVTSSCVGGSIPSNACDGNFYAAESDLEWFLKTFGDDFYIELQHHGIEVEERAFEYMREIAQKYNIPTVITTDAHYLDETDPVNHDALLCIGTGQYVDQKDRTFKFEGTGYHYMSQEEVEAMFPYDKDAIYRAGEIADKIDDQVIDFGELKLPDFDISNDPEFEAWKAQGGVSRWLTD